LPHLSEQCMLCAMMNELYGTSHVSTWINQHENTVRDWSKRYSAFLSPNANAGRRRFTREDVRVLATIASLRTTGLSLDAVEEVLKQGKFLQDDEMPTEPDPEAEEARKNIDMVYAPKERIESALAVQELQLVITRKEDELRQTELRLEEAVDERDKLRTRVLELERDIAAAKARLEIIEQERKPFSWWLLLIAGIAIAALVIVGAVYFISTLGLGSA
jgi:DNA-binding transcriptional MerR regulator